MVRKWIEALGVIILMFTILGVVTTIDWTIMTSTTYFVSIFGIFFIIISLVGSLLRICGFDSFIQKIMLMNAWVLAIFSSTIFYIFPHFFTETLMFPTHFWAMVSLYSIPAICAEGALFNFFFYYPPWNSNERKLQIPTWYSLAFIVYATFAILINFLAIFTIITPYAHILFARSILIIALLGYIYATLKIRL